MIPKTNKLDIANREKETKQQTKNRGSRDKPPTNQTPTEAPNQQLNHTLQART